MHYYKFIPWDAIPTEEALQHPTIKAFLEYEKGDKKALKNIHSVLEDPVIRFGGWCFNLRPFLKRYWVKFREYGIKEFYSLRKTDIRKKFGSYVIEIIEIKKEDSNEWKHYTVWLIFKYVIF